MENCKKKYQGKIDGYFLDLIQFNSCANILVSDKGIQRVSQGYLFG